MKRLPPTFRWVLSGFFTCCCVLPAWAQAVKPATLASDSRLASTSPATRSLDQHRETLVELAWLADPATFSHALVARVAGAEVHVMGSVGDTRAKEHAILIAGQQSGLRAIDHLQYAPILSPKPVNRPISQLGKDAQQVLNEALPLRRGQIQVQVWNDGQLIVKGKVRSDAERLAASRCFKRLPGCTCVINQLEVVGENSVSLGVTGVLVKSRPADEKTVEVVTQSAKAAIPEAGMRASPVPQETVSDGIILVNGESSEPTQVKLTKAPAVKLESPQPLSATKLVEVIPAHVETPKPMRNGLATLSHVHARIATVCNRMPHEVVVQEIAPGCLTIKLKVKTRAEGESLCKAICNMPEIAPYTADLDITVTP